MTASRSSRILWIVASMDRMEEWQGRRRACGLRAKAHAKAEEKAALQIFDCMSHKQGSARHE